MGIAVLALMPKFNFIYRTFLFPEGMRLAIRLPKLWLTSHEQKR